MRRLKVLCLTCITAAILTGCIKTEGTIKVQKDGSVKTRTIVYYNKQETDAASKEIGDSISANNLPIQTIDGVDYYVDEQEKRLSAKDLEASSDTCLIGKDYFYLKWNSEPSTGQSTSGSADTDISGIIDFVSIDVTLRERVKKTNGVVGEDGKSVHWEWSTKENTPKDWYAYGSKSKHSLDADREEVKKNIRVKSDRKAPTIKKVETKKLARVYVKDDCFLKKVTINGKSKKFSKKNFTVKGKYKGYYSYVIKKTKKVKQYVVFAVDAAGNSSTICFS